MLPRADLNVTPMMDVMIVLLMIFMVMVPAIDAAVDLPVAANPEQRPTEPDEIVLKIDERGTYVLETPDVWGSTGAWGWSWVVGPDSLESRLSRLYARRTKDRVLYLKADKGLPFGPVERAIEIARRSGVRVVAAVAERKAVAR